MIGNKFSRFGRSEQKRPGVEMFKKGDSVKLIKDLEWYAELKNPAVWQTGIRLATGTHLEVFEDSTGEIACKRGEAVYYIDEDMLELGSITPHKGGRTISRRTDVTPETAEILARLREHGISLGDLVEEASRQKLDEVMKVADRLTDYGRNVPGGEA